MAVGHRMPAWVDAAFSDYTKRMPQEARVELSQVKPASRSGGVGIGIGRAMALEETHIERAIPPGVERVLLDERGVALSSVELAGKLRLWLAGGRDVALVIGGADGLTERFRRSADLLLSLSQLTLPHGLARVVLVEQLYRAISIVQKHPYHRA